MRSNNDEYRRVVSQLHSLVAIRIVDHVSNVDDLFNMQIGPSAATLISIRDNLWAKDSDRIKASLAFLDRATKAPKAQQISENRSVVINLPVKVMEEMRVALEQEGSQESIDVIKMMDGLEKGEKFEGEGEETIPVRRVE
jgi:hypothetical protein